MTTDPAAFDPASAACWIAHGRRPEHADVLASVWTDYPDLPSDAPLHERMARSRARVAALRPFNDAIRGEAERERQRANFACIEKQVASGQIRPFDRAILHGRAQHGYDWGAAVLYAQGRYAAEQGWEPRDFSAPSGETSPAYAQGFCDAGGCFEDLFDVARRSYAAAMRQEGRFPAPGKALVSRPAPSSWPSPTDAPRPALWSKRTVIIGAATASNVAAGLMTMLQAQPGHEMAHIIIADAGRGFRKWPSVDLHQIGDPVDQLRAMFAGIEPDDLLIIANGEDLAWIDRHAGVLPLCRTMERTRNSAIQQRAQLRAWLERGLCEGEVLAGGHIRWTKLAQGLSGRLGEFVARYAGKAQPRGHRLVIELRDGEPATGFMTPQGEPLSPEAIITNKAHMRRHMAGMLRRFAAAIPHHRDMAARTARPDNPGVPHERDDQLAGHAGQGRASGNPPAGTD